MQPHRFSLAVSFEPNEPLMLPPPHTHNITLLNIYLLAVGFVFPLILRAPFSDVFENSLLVHDLSPFRETLI